MTNRYRKNARRSAHAKTVKSNRKAAPRVSLTPQKPSPFSTYTGSPDSEVVASYIRRFKYEPERREEILSQYH